MKLNKTIPVIAALAASLALAPMTSMARDNDHREHGSYSHDRGSKHEGSKKYRHSRERADKHVRNSHKRHGHKYKNKHGHRHHGNKHRGHKHRHGHNSHSHEREAVYVMSDYGHRHPRRFIGLDDLGFMIGIHTGNFELIFRD